MMEELKAQFIEDAKELLADLENKVLQVEQDPDNKATIEDIFRVMHNLKGASGMYGFDNIGRLTHDLETLYDLVREGIVSIDKDIVDITFASSDILRELLFNHDAIPDEMREDFDDMISQLSIMVNEFEGQESPKNEKLKKEAGYFYFILKPFKEIFSRGVNLNYFFEDIKSIGEHKIKLHNTDLSLAQQFEKKECTGVWEVIIKSPSGEEPVKDLFIFMLDDEYELITLTDDLRNDEKLQKIISANIKDSNFDESVKFIQSFCGECIKESASIPPITENKSTENLAKKTLESPKAARVKNLTSSNSEDTIRVASKKLDTLMNLVSELVTTKAHLGLIADSIQEPRLTKAIEAVEKLSKQLSDLALDVRLMPLESLIVNFKRLVRDVASSVNKDVHFEIEGADTELDKTIISGLEKPLMHILRNAIDHGLESKEMRVSRNKPVEGMVKLIAFYSGANVFIQVQDDGGGIDKKKVVAKAIEKGLIKADEKLTEREIYNILFLPGFSTADSLTGISGRGVGMDVVKQQLEDLRGEVEITSEDGLGTTFTLKLPLTLSIIDTLHVKIDSSDYLIPLSDVEGCINRDTKELKNTTNSIIIQDKLVPLINLRKAFNLDPSTSKMQKMVVVRKEDKTLALTVDEVIGEHQAVLKSLGEVFRKQDFISGASIMGDGNVSLVLDTNKLSALTLSTDLHPTN